jgi:hypothetical protein
MGQACIENNKFECFATLNEFLAGYETELEENVFSGMIQHLNDLPASYIFDPIPLYYAGHGKSIFSYGDTRHVSAILVSRL